MMRAWVSALKTRRVMMRRVTTLGLGERLERVLAYAFFWISGIVLLLFEKNRNVRWHALQSIVTFGTLSLLVMIITILRGLLEPIPLLGLLIGFGLGLLLNILWWTWFILWIWLMVMAWIRPDYRLPFIHKWMRYFSL
jgi:uncharacterized membrane protein